MHLSYFRYNICDVHTLQLAISGELKDHHEVSLTGKMWQIAIEVRTSKIDAFFCAVTGRGAILDEATC